MEGYKGALEDVVYCSMVSPGSMEGSMASSTVSAAAGPCAHQAQSCSRQDVAKIYDASKGQETCMHAHLDGQIAACKGDAW